jgi:predicted ATP-grasp superfamily ATP-dependent carboligase
VVVLQAATDYYAHGHLAAARTLGRLGVRVLAVHDDSHTPAALSRYAEHLEWRIATNPVGETLHRLAELATALGERPLLVPVDDVGALFVDDHATELHASFRLPDQPTGLARTLANKARLYELCKQHGVATPEAWFPRSRDEAVAYAEQAGFPIVFKSMDPEVLRNRPNAVSVSLVSDREGLLACYDRMEDPAQPNLMLQEYIPGTAESVWMFNGYFSRDGQSLVGFTGQKIRQSPHGTGATTLGVCRHNDVVIQAARSFLSALGYRGIVDMGYRYDARDGCYKVLDVNPRLGSTFRLFVDDQHLDVLRAMYLDLTGQTVPPRGPYDGRRWWVEPLDLWTVSDYRHLDSLTWAQWARSLRAVREAAWFAHDDPAPFAAITGLVVARAAYRGLSRNAQINQALRRIGRRLTGGRLPRGSPAPVPLRS